MRAENGGPIPAAWELAAWFETPEEPQQPIKDRQRMGRTSRNVEVDGDQRPAAVVDFGVIDEWPAADGAGPHRNDELGGGDRRIGRQQGEAHVLADRAGDDDAVGVPRRSDELDAETAQVEDDRTEHVQVGLAGVAAGGADLPELERPPKEPAGFLVQGFRELQCLPFKFQVVTLPGRQPVVLSVVDGPFRASVHAIGTEQAAPKIKLQPTAPMGDGIRGAGLDAGMAAVRTLRRVHDGQAAKAIRQWGDLLWVGDRPVPLSQAGKGNLEHGVSLQVVSTVG